MTRFSFATVGFDLDGTLLDTSGDLTAAANHALARLGRPALSVAEVIPLIGGGGRHMLGQAVANTGAVDDATLDAAYAQLLAFYEAHIADHTRPYPHVAETLAALRAEGVTLAVVTNKQEGLSRAVLGRLGLLDHFATVIGGDTLGPGRGKPRPDMLLAMIERCGGPAAFVGDSRYDVEAARAARLPVIACSFGYVQGPVAALGADAVIEGFDQLIPALAGLDR